MSPSNKDANNGPVKARVGGIKIKVVVKKRRRKTTSRRAQLPPSTNTTTTPRAGLVIKPPPRQHAQEHSQQEDNNTTHSDDAHDYFENDNVQEEEIPCDTLLAIRSLEQTRTCLDIPLVGGGTIPSVLESQLQAKLQSHNDYDSIVTAELQHLTRSNTIRRLTSSSSSHASNSSRIVEAVLETRHYKRAIWDAHRHYHGSNPNVTAAFVSCLDRLTKRLVSIQDLQESWPTTTCSWNEKHVDILVQMQVLLPIQQEDAYIFWLPHWGLVLKQLTKAQQKVITQLKRSLYKELSQSQVEQMHHSGLSGPFVLHTLVAQGLVELQERPSGTFCRLLVT